MNVLESAWLQCFEDIGASIPPSNVWDELRARYCEPHRAYHTLQHLEECFAQFDEVRAETEHPGDVAFALFYHDAIYDTHASDNEAKSARLGMRVLEDYVRGDADGNRVSDLIMATRHEAVPETADARLLVDIDLSILGAAPERFAQYEDQIRFEYAWVDAEAYRGGRGRILRQFLDRPKIYNLVFFRDRFETPARENLARSLLALGAA